MRDAAIGIFDSGLGGLTVARAIRAALPAEDLVYLGDTARVPYGTRSPDTIVRYARACAERLVAHDVKVLVVACNTVSAVALDHLRDELDVPVLGVIEPGARAGARASAGRVGVIATQGTVNSGAYERALHAVDSRIEAFVRPAPMLVPLAEEGWLEGEVPELVCERYLAPLAELGITSLVLGCTHYPLLGDTIRKVVARLAGDGLRVVDGAEATAEELAEMLARRGLGTTRAGEGAFTIEVTDLPGRFAEVASRFLGRSVEGLGVRQVDL